LGEGNNGANPDGNAQGQGAAAPTITNSAAAGAAEQEGCMTPEELKKNHPDIYAAVFEDGKKAGIEAERSRVNAHLKMGETVKDFSVSAKFIKEGKPLSDDEVVAEYQSIGIKKSMIAARNADDPKALTNGGNASSGGDAGMEQALAAMDKELHFSDKGAN
jgi:uncharacterized GH25 family protein